ncbi:hypothetical protein [Alloprevotella tannerae]|jgi:hypothetical protein
MMKKYLLVFVAAVMAITVWGQSASEHLRFKGVPITGTPEAFARNLRQKGLTVTQTDNDGVLLSGSFAGYKDCSITVSTSKDRNTVSSVSVAFPSRNTWTELERDYSNLKSMLTTKYGEPHEAIEVFEGSTAPKTDEDRIYKVKFDQCKYFSIFWPSKGRILLQIVHYGTENCYVLLSYIDEINYGISYAPVIDDL